MQWKAVTYADALRRYRAYHNQINYNRQAELQYNGATWLLEPANVHWLINLD